MTDKISSFFSKPESIKEKRKSSLGLLNDPLQKEADPPKLHVNLGLRAGNVATSDRFAKAPVDQPRSSGGAADGVLQLPIRQNRRIKPT